MAISEKFSRFPTLECEDLQCHDTLETSLMDTDMGWRTTDKDFLISLIENEYNVNPYYLDSRQIFITSGMRSLLVDWVMEICSEFFLKRETCYRAVSYIDRFLSESASAIRKEQFQLLGLTSCYIAAKIEEISLPRLMDFSKSAGNIYTVRDINTMERLILQTLQWKTLQPTSFTICDWLMTQWDLYIIATLGENSQNFTLKDMRGYKRHREITQLIDAATLEIGVLRFKPRILAACACYLVLFKTAKEQKYAMLLAGKSFYNEVCAEQYAGLFMEIFMSFIAGALEIHSFDEMYPCGFFMNKFMEIHLSYEFPSICKTGLKPEAHYQEFLGYQTYNPLCIQVLHSRVKSGL